MFRVYMKFENGIYSNYVLFANNREEAERIAYRRFGCLAAVAYPETVQISDAAKTVERKLNSYEAF